MKTPRNTKTVKNTIYTEIDGAIWLYNYVTGSKLRKMTDIPNTGNREEFINEMIKFYNEKAIQ